MLERKQYENPPLVEVFCEFFFEPADGAGWDSLLMGEFYRDLGKEAYPKKKRVKAVGIEVKLGSSEGPRIQHHGPPTPRHQFISADGNSIVQAGENMLVVNQMPPYYGWERFEGEVARVLDVYLSVWGIKSVTRVALHYIDRIDIPGETIQLEDYFRLYPVLPESLMSRPIANLAMAFEMAGESEGDVLALTFHQQPSADPDKSSFRFQWDYVGTLPRAPEVPRLGEWLRVAHDATSLAFRSTITPRCESLFVSRKELDHANGNV